MTTSSGTKKAGGTDMSGNWEMVNCCAVCCLCSMGRSPGEVIIFETGGRRARTGRADLYLYVGS
jgi:hypothetical protein